MKLINDKKEERKQLQKIACLYSKGNYVPNEVFRQYPNNLTNLLFI